VDGGLVGDRRVELGVNVDVDVAAMAPEEGGEHLPVPGKREAVTNFVGQ
jgi:hypothetical protein